MKIQVGSHSNVAFLRCIGYSGLLPGLFAVCSQFVRKGYHNCEAYPKEAEGNPNQIHCCFSVNESNSLHSYD